MSITPLIPKVTTEDVRLTLNGIYSGSTYTFWEQNISSGSVLAQINLANYWMYGSLGKEVMDSQDQTTYFHVKACQLAYSCLRTLVVLSGGVITDGFNFTAGITVQQPSMLSSYKNMISEFKELAELHFRALTPIGYSMDCDPMELHDTPPSMM